VTEGFGHGFGKPELLRQALATPQRRRPQQRAHGVLGDALVNLIVAEALHARWPKADEGASTRARAALVRESALAEIARNSTSARPWNSAPAS
jgi:ribonuclease-3